VIDDFRTYDSGATLDTDLCVVGSGAAGIALAREFLGSGVRVLVVESGGLDPHAATDRLNEGENVGHLPIGLTAGRSRVFGGTTRLWAGQCVPLDDVDFEARPWVPHSGWPIHRRDLDPFYERAERVMHIAGEVYDERLYARFGIRPPALDPAKLAHRSTVYTPRPDLGTTYRTQFERSRNVRVLLHASVTRLAANESRSAVSHAELRALDGKSARVAARAFVLCGGGIENARLLLLSDGLGNAYDLVGRFFQDHPNSRAAVVESDNPACLQDPYSLLYKGRFRYYPKVRLAPELQRSQEVLNCAAMVNSDFGDQSGIEAAKRIYRALRRGERPRQLAREGRLMAGDVVRIAAMTHRRYVRGLSPTSPNSTMWLQTYAEQAPNRDSRVLLSEKRDPLGVPLARVDWRLTELDRRTAAAMATTVASEFTRLRLGRVHVGEWLTNGRGEWAQHLYDAYHHMGTTRMSEDPALGVVDRECQVHGIGGLYVAGSSVFPTSGYANPTLTIVALALRLADRLKATVVR
jgi:choline dehydrogenase-like flavoprotein